MMNRSKPRQSERAARILGCINLHSGDSKASLPKRMVCRAVPWVEDVGLRTSLLGICRILLFCICPAIGIG